MEESKENTDCFGRPIPDTVFEEAELLTGKELKEVLKMMPYAVRKSVKMAKKGELPQISREKLECRLAKYFETQNINHVQRINPACEPAGEIPIGGTRKREDSI